MLEGETTQKKKKPKKLFSFTRNQPLPLAQDHLIPLFRLKIRNSAPPLFFLFFSFFSSRQWRLGGNPYFFSSPATSKRGFFFILASSPQQWAETHEPGLSSFPAAPLFLQKRRPHTEEKKKRKEERELILFWFFSPAFPYPCF